MFIFSHCSFVDTDTGQALRHPETQVSIDREKVSDLGVKMGTIASGLRTMVGGEKVSLFREGDEQYNVRLRLIADYRKDAGQIENLTVPGADGNLVKLSNATRFISGTSPAQVDRYAQERQITVISNLYKKPLGEAITESNIILKEMNMPSAYSASFLGRGKLMQEAFYNFMIAFVLSLPFGLLSLLIFGSTLNIYSFMGMFVLIGVVKKNAILVVDYTNTLREHGMQIYEAQIEANRVRLRPILMTTLAIMAGLTPVALGKG